MAGSLNHIIGDNGKFFMDLIENLGDAHEALEECFAIIYHLSGGKLEPINEICGKLRFPRPRRNMVLES